MRTTFIILFISPFICLAQNNVGIGTTTPDNSSVLDVSSSSKGVLLPRLSSQQRLNISNPADGLLVFDINADCFFFYQSSTSLWQSLCNTVGLQGPTGATGATGPSGGPIGPTGPMGISNVETHGVIGAGELVATTTFQIAPGLSLPITLIDSATLNIFTYGVVDQTNITLNYIRSEIQIFLDNTPIPTTKQTIRVETMNDEYPNIHNWSISSLINLPQGNYVFDVRCRKPDGSGFTFGSNSMSNSALIIQVFYDN